MSYSFEPREKKHVKSYIVLSFARKYCDKWNKNLLILLLNWHR